MMAELSVKVTAPATRPGVKVTRAGGSVSTGGGSGKSAYELWLELPGNAGKTLEQFFAAYKGADGTSFTIRGTVATEADLDDIVGPGTGDAYKVEETDHIWSYSGTGWVDVGAITAGNSAYEDWLTLPGNAGKTLEDFLESLQGAPGANLDADFLGGMRVTALTADTDIIGARVTDL